MPTGSDFKDILDIGADVPAENIKDLIRVYYVINSTSEFDSAEGVEGITKMIDMSDKHVDSKLCEGGKAKANKIYEEWFTKKGFTPKNSVAVCSQLRVAFGTALLATSGEHLKIFVNERLNEITSSKNSTPHPDKESLKKYANELKVPTADYCIETFTDSDGPVRHVEFYKNLVQTRCEEEFGSFWSYVVDHDVLEILKEKEKNLIVFGHQEWFKHFSAIFKDCTRWFYTSSIKIPNCTVLKFDIVCKTDGNLAFGAPTIDYMQEPLKFCGIHHKLERGLRHVKKRTLQAAYKEDKLKNAHAGLKNAYGALIGRSPANPFDASEEAPAS